MIECYLTIDIRNTIMIHVAVMPSDHTVNYPLQLQTRETTDQSSVKIKPGFMKKFQVVPKFLGNVYWEVVSENSQKSVFAIDICITG